MSLFHIPEITALIGPYLSTRDLVHFCLVNKTWNVAFTPYLKQSVPLKSASSGTDTHSRLTHVCNSFRTLIEEDILDGRQHLQLQEDHKNSNGTFLSLPVLSKNGHWIRSIAVDQHFYWDFTVPNHPKPPTCPPGTSARPSLLSTPQ